MQFHQFDGSGQEEWGLVIQRFGQNKSKLSRNDMCTFQVEDIKGCVQVGKRV